MQTTKKQDYTRKLAKAFAEAQAAGMKRSAYDNWAYRGLRRLGVRIKPPVYSHLGWLMLWSGVYFAVFWGGGMHIFLWRDNTLIVVQLGTSLIAGIMFGAITALVARFMRRKHRLTPWSEL